MSMISVISGSGKSVPSAPTIGTATDVGTGRAYNNGAATVTFTAPTYTGRLPIASYTVTSSPGGFTASGASSPLTVTGLQSSTSYTFTVTATNALGTSAASSASNSITATTVPQAPTIGTATAGAKDSGQATVTYTAGATGGKAVSAYTATSSPGSITGSGASPITVSGLTNGTAYTFTVTATNANGTSTASAASNSITVPSGIWIAVGASEALMTSTDGLTWQTRNGNVPSGNAIQHVAYQNNLYMTISGGTYFRTSTDAITWTSYTSVSNLSIGFNNLRAANGYFGVASNEYSRVKWSTNGTSWNTTVISAVDAANEIVYQNLNYVNGYWACYQPLVTWYATSPNGTWSSAGNGIGANMRRGAYGNGRYVIGNDSGLAHSSSISGTMTFVSGSGFVYDVEWSGSEFIAVGDASRILVSSNGTTWTSRAIPASPNFFVTYNSGLWVIGSVSGVLTSPNGSTWTVRSGGNGVPASTFFAGERA
jgi:hypothetical protein